MQKLIGALLIVAGIVHLLPLSGVVGPERLAALYGIGFAEANLQILMRHRAVLFGLLGVFLVAAAFVPRWRGAAIGAGLVSVVSFLLIAWWVGGYNASIERVVLVDWVALGCLLAAAGLSWVRRREG